MKSYRFYVILIFWAAVLITSNLSRMLWLNAGADSLSEFKPESPEFREMKLSGKKLTSLLEAEAYYGQPASELLSLSWLYRRLHGGRGFLPAQEREYLLLKQAAFTFNRSGYEKIRKAYQKVWDDAEVFPVQENGIVYENSWMFERSYGGLRGHEGTDLMPPENLPGHFKVVSMTEGTVEKIGWLEKGGYRIGIRSPRGGYYYYAHLDSYAQEFVPGQSVEAGRTAWVYGRQRIRSGGDQWKVRCASPSWNLSGDGDGLGAECKSLLASAISGGRGIQTGEGMKREEGMRCLKVGPEEAAMSKCDKRLRCIFRAIMLK